jgi:uracil-DNA glycosylase
MKTKQYWIDKFGESWVDILKPLLKHPHMEELINKITFDYAILEMYPENQDNIFKAFRLCPFDQVRAVIIGTEPGPHTGSNGLAFGGNNFQSNSSSVLIRNCVEQEYNDLKLDFDFTFESWAKQGILMLNRNLTCRKGEINTHKQDWKSFFFSVIYILEKYKPGTIFLLWGTQAQKYSELLSQNHHVFSWEHPMKAFSEYRQWHCPNFKQVDNLIESLNGTKIQW